MRPSIENMGRFLEKQKEDFLQRAEKAGFTRVQAEFLWVEFERKTYDI